MGIGLKAILLTGGLGTRLYPLTLIIPKPLLMFGDKTIAEHILNWLKENGIRDVIIATSRKKELFKLFLGKIKGIRIEYVESEKPLGTAGQLRHAARNMKKAFIVVYGDGIIKADLRKMIEFHRRNKPLATIMAMQVEEKLKYGYLEFDENNNLLKWEEKPVKRGWISVGCYILEPRFLKYIPEEVYGMDEAFRNALRAGEKILVFKAEGKYIDLGDRDSYYKAVSELKEEIGRIP